MWNLLVHGIGCVVDEERLVVTLPISKEPQHFVNDNLFHQALGLDVFSVVPASQCSCWSDPQLPQRRPLRYPNMCR